MDNSITSISQEIKSIWPNWEIIGVIGKGTFGTVYSAIDTRFPDVKAAIKHVEIKFPDDIEASEADRDDFFENSINNILSEINIYNLMKRVPNLVQIEDYAIKRDKQSVDVFIRMELLETLSEFIDRQGFTENDLVKLGIDIAEALNSLHSMGIIHRDIKPSNIFCYKTNFKLGDFSIATFVKDVPDFAGGSAITIAPEVVYSLKSDFRSDIYSLGMTLYYIANGFKPLQMQERFNHKIPALNLSSDKLRNVIEKACSYKPEDRFQSALELVNALKEIKLNTIIPILQKETGKSKEHDFSSNDEKIIQNKTVIMPFNNKGSGTFTAKDTIDTSKDSKTFTHRSLLSWLFSTCMISIIPTIFYLMCIIFIKSATINPEVFLHEFLFFSIVLLTTMMKTVFFGKGMAKYRHLLLPIGAVAIIMDIFSFVLFSLIIISEVTQNINLKAELFPVAIILCITSFILGGIAEYMEDLVE